MPGQMPGHDPEKPRRHHRPAATFRLCHNPTKRSQRRKGLFSYLLIFVARELIYARVTRSCGSAFFAFIAEISETGF
jgi:hypothetical protein